MNRQRLLDTFLELVRIDSVSYNEAAVAAYCKQALEQAGCEVHIDDTAAVTGSNTGNLIALLPARPPAAPPARLYFSAHMDTVNPGQGIVPIIEDGIIRPQGQTILGGDDKVGVAAIIELVRSLAESDRPHPEIGVLLSVCEEVSLLGAYAIDDSGFSGQPCLVLDANGSPGIVIIGAPFHIHFTVTFSGVAAHAGIEPERGVSAIDLAARALTGMQLGRLDAHTTANIGTIRGGNANNIVADSCVVTGEFRAMDKQRLGEVQDQLQLAIDQAVEGSGGQADVQWHQQYPGFEVPQDDKLVQLVLEQAHSLGLPAKAIFTGGGSDANVLADKGLHPLVLGTGMTNVHGLSEQLAVKDLEDLTSLCLAVSYAYGQ